MLRLMGSTLFATLAAAALVLTIPSCDSDIAVVKIVVQPEGSAVVTIARVRDASDASEIDHPLIRGTGTVQTTNLAIQINRAQATRVNNLDIGGITFNLIEQNTIKVLEVYLPPSKRNAWYTLLPKLDAALDVQSLRQDPFIRRGPLDPPLSDSRVAEIASEGARLRLVLELVVPWKIRTSRMDARGAKVGWRATTPDNNKGVLLIPIDYPELEGDVVVWRLES
jgi:hypothetical protein